MTIYYIVDEDNTVMKIGYTHSDPGMRLADLQVGNPKQLRTAKLTDGGLSEERDLHHAYRARHIRGEWFELDPALIYDAIPPDVSPLSRPAHELNSRTMHKHDMALMDRLIRVRLGPRQFAEALGVRYKEMWRWRESGVPYKFRAAMYRLAWEWLDP